jgi:hypothetical protein
MKLESLDVRTCPNSRLLGLSSFPKEAENEKKIKNDINSL